jgi:hypothetical protein
MISVILAVGRWLLGSTVGRIILGVLAFLIWLHFHDARLEARVRQEIVAEQAKLALQRIENLEKNNADFNSLPDRERCLVFMRDSGLPESNCSEP